MTKKQNELEQDFQRIQPHDVDTERAVLSSLIMYNDKFSKYGDLLDVNLFYYEKERAIFRCIDGVINSGSVTDINSLYAYSQSHDIGYQLFKGDFAEVVTNLNRMTLEQDIMRLCELSRRRMCFEVLYRASQNVLVLTNEMDTELSEVMNYIGELQSGSVNCGITTNDEAMDGVIKTVDDNRTNRGRALHTGFKLFDERYLLRPNTMTVIAAFTSVGKSTLAMNILENVAASGVPCANYSLEMSCAELASRMISKDADLSASEIMNRRLNDEKVIKVKEAINKKTGLPIYYDDRSTADFNRTLRSIRKMVKTKGVKLVVIDYLQIYAQVKDDAEESLGYMARSAKNLAKELGISIILISQLNRSGLHPTIKMLRGSGQIEESADNVVLIDRPEAYPDNKVTKYEGEFKNCSIKGTAKLILAKGRGVGTGSALVAFDSKHVRFSEFNEPKEAGNYEEQEEALPF